MMHCVGACKRLKSIAQLSPSPFITTVTGYGKFRYISSNHLMNMTFTSDCTRGAALERLYMPYLNTENRQGISADIITNSVDVKFY